MRHLPVQGPVQIGVRRAGRTGRTGRTDRTGRLGPQPQLSHSLFRFAMSGLILGRGAVQALPFQRIFGLKLCLFLQQQPRRTPGERNPGDGALAARVQFGHGRGRSAVTFAQDLTGRICGSGERLWIAPALSLSSAVSMREFLCHVSCERGQVLISYSRVKGSSAFCVRNSSVLPFVSFGRVCIDY